MSGRDARSRTGRIVSLLTLTLLILRAQDAFSGSEVPRLEVGDPAALSGLNEVLSNAVRDARTELSESACSQIFADYRDAGYQQTRRRARQVPFRVRQREPRADDLDAREGQHRQMAAPAGTLGSHRGRELGHDKGLGRSGVLPVGHVDDPAVIGRSGRIACGTKRLLRCCGG